MKTRKFGYFPKAIVSISAVRISPNLQQPHPTPSYIATPSQQQNQNISKPVPGSLIHTGHGDIDQDHCWGHIDKIDDLYLKNPVTKPIIADTVRTKGVSFIPSITNLHDNGVLTAGVPQSGEFL